MLPLCPRIRRLAGTYKASRPQGGNRVASTQKSGLRLCDRQVKPTFCELTHSVFIVLVEYIFSVET